RTHYRQLPAVIVAPALGGIFTAWVLWRAVDTHYLLIGLAGVLSISVLRIGLYKWYQAEDADASLHPRWRFFAIATATVSGVIWGSAAIFLYPPLLPEYEVYMLVLLALIPVAPVAALAVYMPAFYAYYIPCIAPFIIMLGLQDNRAERMTALLLIMMMGATLTFANKYSAMLAEAIRLRLKLADKKEALEQSITVKTRFLAAASHDLRQPVHAMGLFIESLASSVRDIDSRRLLSQVTESVVTLRRMLDAMLDVSRLDAEVVETQRRSFRLNTLLIKLHHEYISLAEQKGLRFDCVDSRVVVNSDPVLLERILRNLLTNAIRYTRQGGIVLGCRRRGECVQVWVCDTGVGIPVSRQEEIFHEFTQLQNAERNPGYGLGLGLSIVKRLADLLKHKIQVRSREGTGSTFSIELPCSAERPQEMNLPAEEYPAACPEHRNLLILIIDDDKSIRLGMTALLESWKFKATSSATGHHALKKIRERGCVPDLVIIDYRLSQGETAPDVIARLKAELDDQIPFIIVTGDTAPDRIREAHYAGYLLLHKPVDPDRLKVCINALLDPAARVVAP
ncbi:hypothetical protein MNBD_GAMMA14-259, partial [hydrothermal vent metagenome]